MSAATKKAFPTSTSPSRPRQQARTPRESGRPAGLTPLPDISAEEKKFPRNMRTTLVQLQSRLSRMLNNYMNSIDPNINNQYPDCGVTLHNTHTCSRAPATRKTSRWAPSGWTPSAWPDFSGWTWTMMNDSGYNNSNNNNNLRPLYFLLFYLAIIRMTSLYQHQLIIFCTQTTCA